MQVLMACMMEQQQQRQQSVQAANPISSDPPQSSGTLQKPSPSALANRGEQADSLPIPKRMDRMCRQMGVRSTFMSNTKKILIID